MPRLERGVDDLLQARELPFPEGDVRGEHGPRAARLDAVPERLRAEAGEDDGVDRPDPDGGEQEHDRLRAGRHVDRDAVALLDAEPAQRGGDPLHLVEELAVREDAALAALVRVDERGVPCPAAPHVAVERVPGEVRPPAHEPAELREAPLEHVLPALEPGQVLGGAGPEAFRVLASRGDPAADDRVHEVHGSSSPDALKLGSRKGARQRAPD